MTLLDLDFLACLCQVLPDSKENEKVTTSRAAENQFRKRIHTGYIVRGHELWKLKFQVRPGVSISASFYWAKLCLKASPHLCKLSGGLPSLKRPTNSSLSSWLPKSPRTRFCPDGLFRCPLALW